MICLLVDYSFTLVYKNAAPSSLDFLSGIGFEINYFVSKKENSTQIPFQNIQVNISFKNNKEKNASENFKMYFWVQMCAFPTYLELAYYSVILKLYTVRCFL